MTYIKWRCKYCGDVKISNSKRRHQMDICKCKKTSIDLEGGYMRVFGLHEILKLYDYNFFNEILICMLEQGFEEGFFILGDKKYIHLNKVFQIRKLEDKIIKGLK